MINICQGCYYRKVLRWNLLKKDITYPRVYFIECGLSPSDGLEKCEYFKKKLLKHRLGIDY